MVELLPALGGLGAGGALAVVIVYLLSSNRADRGQAVDRIEAANNRADKAETRADELQTKLDGALARARVAEDEVARLRRDVGTLPPSMPGGGLP